ncbi:hypothetical protein K9N68_37040 (plasmid) [Kovacikia minuta CCNUW1]|uniref:hypothetical protein n=1 Tax=Kovacikia minuta TaxID=2931930 RepID=UPI001CC92C1B|nr:hypothetical protein [Kovacikia minuta]UBF30737.1 hypothetical protein K9N68_37040 [Kovacikia minuta CCNUW1]
MHSNDDLQKLLGILPLTIQQQLNHHPQRDSLVEVVLDLGRRPEAGSNYARSTSHSTGEAGNSIPQIGYRTSAVLPQACGG